MPTPRLDNSVNTIDRLRQRIACNQSSSRLFSSFVLEVLSPRAEDVALDIGAGLGGQLLPVAERVRRVVGLDVSAAMVAELGSRIGDSRARIVHADMDDLAGLDLDGPFSLIYAVYSIYYSRDPAKVVRLAAALLGEAQARFACINPDIGNNEGWFADLQQLYALPPDTVGVPRIGREVILPAMRESFENVSCMDYEDRIHFGSVEAIMIYYDACTPYCRADKREEARRYFEAKIERQGGYEITKRSLALVGLARA